MSSSILSIVLLALVASSALAGIVSDNGFLRVDGTKIVGNNGPITLRGMSLFWSEWMGQFWNADVINWLVSDWHVTLVRAAMGAAPEDGGYMVDPDTQRQHVIDVVEACITNDIYVIIDWHDYNGAQHTDAARGFFTDMASRYGNVPNVIFETWNEPLDSYDWSSQIKPYHEDIVGTIRTMSQNLCICGTRTWSQRVDEAANDPVQQPNVAYTLHFYVSTHKQELRDIAQTAINAGAALFVTEMGLSEASGDGYLDEGEWENWSNFIENNQISWANWAIDDKSETSAALVPGASTTGGWGTDQLSQSGNIIRSDIISRQ